MLAPLDTPFMLQVKKGPPRLIYLLGVRTLISPFINSLSILRAHVLTTKH